MTTLYLTIDEKEQSRAIGVTFSTLLRVHAYSQFNGLRYCQEGLK